MFSYIYKLLSRKSTPKKSIVEELLEFSSEDYPFLPLPEPKVRSDDYKEIIFSNFFPEKFEVPENLILSKSVFESFILAKTSPSENLEKQVKFWKKYAYDRMSEIMENARTNPYDMDSISACPYLSVEILNEYNNVKYNWEIVTRNFFITNRDILNNPDLPWDEISLYNHRNLPKGFYQYKGIKYLREFDPEESFLIKTSKYDTFLSPIEPREYPIKEDEIINNEEVSTALQLIKDTSPEYFVSSSKVFIKEIEKIIAEMIKTNGTFILDDFVFPVGYFNDDEEIDDKDVFSIPEPTEDDPYSVRNSIKSIKENGLSKYSKEGRFYFSKIGLSIEYLVKNRAEYLELLNSGEVTHYYINPVCECVFFEPEDFYKYNKNFTSDTSDSSFSNVMSTSGKLTLEYYLEHQDIDWNIEDLVKCLPVEYVIRNLLFYPNRLKFDSKLIDDYYTNVSKLRENILHVDEKLIGLFSSREDVRESDYDIFYKYPMIEWKLKDYNDTHSQLNKFKSMTSNFDKINYKLPITKLNPFLYNFNTLSWDYIISYQGVREFCESFEKTIDFDEFETKTNEEKKDVILNFVKMSKELMIFFADIIPSSFICKNKKTKWIAPYYVNIDRLFKSYIEETGSFDGFFLLLTMFVNYSFSNHNVNITTVITKQLKQLFGKLIKDMYENNEDKSYVYEFFVKNSVLLANFDRNFNIQNTLTEFEFPTTVGTYVKISDIFTFEDIVNSKYPNFSIINKYIMDCM